MTYIVVWNGLSLSINTKELLLHITGPVIDGYWKGREMQVWNKKQDIGQKRQEWGQTAGRLLEIMYKPHGNACIMTKCMIKIFDYPSQGLQKQYRRLLRYLNMSWLREDWLLALLRQHIGYFDIYSRHDVAQALRGPHQNGMRVAFAKGEIPSISPGLKARHTNNSSSDWLVFDHQQHTSAPIIFSTSAVLYTRTPILMKCVPVHPAISTLVLAYLSMQWWYINPCSFSANPSREQTGWRGSKYFSMNESRKWYIIFNYF